VSQGIAIFFAIAFLLAIVALVWVNSLRKTWKAQAEANSASAAKASQDAAAAKGEAAELRSIAGFAETDALEAVRSAFEDDMKKYAPGVTEEGKKYRAVLANLAEENRKLVLNNVSAAENVKKLTASLAAIEAQKNAQIKQFEDEIEKIRQDMADARKNFEDQYARVKTDNEGIQKQMAELRATHEKAIADLEKQKTQLENQIATLKMSIDKLRLGVPNPDMFAQPADGEITYVDQKNGIAWVNLGSADGLRPQVTFAVAEAGLEDAATAEKKGSIEITKIEGPHLAEARITDDDPKNPLLPRDRIFSQVWDRGRQVGFGIAGFVDLDKDGNSDLEKLKGIIAASGGVVDAAPDATGKKTGELKVSTRYLILGEYPNDVRSGDLRTSWGELSEEAESLGVETIGLDEFLSLIGWQTRGRSVAMGRGARAEDFPPVPPGEQLPRRQGTAAGAFKPRLPKTPY
jgi:hypothetical protein